MHFKNDQTKYFRNYSIRQLFTLGLVFSRHNQLWACNFLESVNNNYWHNSNMTFVKLSCRYCVICECVDVSFVIKCLILIGNWCSSFKTVFKHIDFACGMWLNILEWVFNGTILMMCVCLCLYLAEGHVKMSKHMFDRALRIICHLIRSLHLRFELNIFENYHSLCTEIHCFYTILR